MHLNANRVCILNNLSLPATLKANPSPENPKILLEKCLRRIPCLKRHQKSTPPRQMVRVGRTQKIEGAKGITDVFATKCHRRQTSLEVGVPCPPRFAARSSACGGSNCSASSSKNELRSCTTQRISAICVVSMNLNEFNIEFSTFADAAQKRCNVNHAKSCIARRKFKKIYVFILTQET